MVNKLATMLKKSGHYDEGEQLCKIIPFSDEEKSKVIAYASICAFYQLLDTDRVIDGVSDSGSFNADTTDSMDDYEVTDGVPTDSGVMEEEVVYEEDEGEEFNWE